MNGVCRYVLIGCPLLLWDYLLRPGLYGPQSFTSTITHEDVIIVSGRIVYLNCAQFVPHMHVIPISVSEVTT